jgi:glycosyltransferase involved in cell wall biosynthesis
MRNLRPLIVVSSPRPSECEWQSLREILPAIERSWSFSQKRPVQILRPRSPAEGLQLLNRFLDAHAIIFTSINSTHADMIRLMRRHFGVRVPMILHLHGDATNGAVALEGIDENLRSSDLFIVSCKAEKLALQKCFKRARVKIIPFALGGVSRKYTSRKPLLKKVPLFCVGRISEQKNLHTLFWALSILKRKAPAVYSRVQALEIYGWEDMLGSPNMGRRSSRYLDKLRRLARQLGITEKVVWRGRRTTSQINNTVLTKPHVLVVPSLHADENFGVVALKSLINGNSAVLSDWGGHRDLLQNFAQSAHRVTVYSSAIGPFINPEDLAKALAASLQRTAAPLEPAIVHNYSTATIAGLMRQSAESIRSSRNALRSTELRLRLLKRRKLRKWSRQRVFLGYHDVWARPFFAAYGAKGFTRRRTNQRRLTLAPWVKVNKNVVCADPHRGRFSFKKAQNQLNRLKSLGLAF